MKTFNKKGDQGTTSLLFGKRVPKSDLHCEAYGTIDEAISSLGVARNLVKKERTRDTLLQVQKELFTVNAELATACEDYDKLASKYRVVTADMADRLEKAIVQLEAEIVMPKSFVVPGANLASASIDVSRAIVRRAERRLVSLKEQGGLKNESLLQYMNRLADLLFVLARYEET